MSNPVEKPNQMKRDFKAQYKEYLEGCGPRPNAFKNHYNLFYDFNALDRRLMRKTRKFMKRLSENKQNHSKGMPA